MMLMGSKEWWTVVQSTCALDAEQLLRELSGSRQRAAVGHALRLALRTGMRASELAGLTWADLHGTHAVLQATKNDDRRVVPLSLKARRLLARLPRDGDMVLGVTPAALDVQFRKARERAGLTGLHFHDSRHTAATWIGRSGRITVLEMCAMFGWRDPGMRWSTSTRRRGTLRGGCRHVIATCTDFADFCAGQALPLTRSNVRSPPRPSMPVSRTISVSLSIAGSGGTWPPATVTTHGSSGWTRNW